MAEHKCEFELKWENDKFFEMTTKLDDAAAIPIIRVEENGAIGLLWKPVTEIVMAEVTRQMKLIGDEMVT